MDIKNKINNMDEAKREKLGEVIRFGYIVSFIFNFIASTRYTFKVKANAKRGAGFTLSHVVNYSMQTICLNLFVGLGLAKQWAMIPTLCICIPVNFLLVRFFLKK